MNKYFQAVALPLAALILLIGCRAFSRQECVAMDWRNQGFNTALKGQSITEGKEFFGRACENVPVKENDFQTGYDEGLKEFCKPESVSKFASKGGQYKGICPAKLVNKGFLTEYQSARENFLLEKIKKLESEISDLEAKTNRLSSALSDSESKLRACESTH